MTIAYFLCVTVIFFQYKSGKKKLPIFSKPLIFGKGLVKETFFCYIFLDIKGKTQNVNIVKVFQLKGNVV